MRTHAHQQTRSIKIQQRKKQRPPMIIAIATQKVEAKAAKE